MSIFKCKMCGGTIEFNPGDTVGVCDSCGTKQTLPRLDDDRKANLYDRANHFRRNNDFDKAAGIYEQILNEDSNDAEAYWSLVLCRYGIEYVEDPQSHKRIPTVNRAQFTSIFDDDNYKSALHYADAAQREIYEEEAKAINEIQKGILAISQKEEPFDVFICYKETDNSGRRTQDSVLANDLYHQLTQEGFKVFFSRITLEDKLGTAYEPYIFAALNSAKVMVVLGTKPEYFNAVWVKNEWSRYLALVKQSGGKKILIPAYKDMDPYDLPEEFSHLQAQDMSKLGFMQDLIRGIKKIVSVDGSKAAVKETVAVGGSVNVDSLLERVFMFLEDSDWDSADEYCEKVLDQDPKNARAYLGKLMAEYGACRLEDLQDCEQPFDDSGNYNKVLRFADSKLIETLKGYIAHINERNENARLTEIYNRAVNAMNEANSEDECKAAAKIFKSIPGFKDADDLVEKCLDKAEICRKDAIYRLARSNMIRNTIYDYESSIRDFETISGWKDADEQIRICQKKIEEIKAKEEADRLEAERKAEAERLEAERKAEEHRIAVEKAKKKAKKVFIAIASAACVCAIFIILLKAVIIPQYKLNKATQLIDSGDYKAAYMLLDGLSYRDSAEKLKSAKQAQIKNAKVGDIVYFGAYEQDNDTSNGKELIEWLVLAKENNRVLVISDKALDCRAYQANSVNYATWEKCSLRKWLNNDFINVAFSDDEKAIIPTVTVSADKNPKYDTDPGNATQDQVFLLSIVEAKKYFSSDSARQCSPTDYAVANGAYESNDNICWWWLRSSGCNQDYAAYVYSNGNIFEDGYYILNSHRAVRPAMWITIDG